MHEFLVVHSWQFYSVRIWHIRSSFVLSYAPSYYSSNRSSNQNGISSKSNHILNIIFGGGVFFLIFLQQDKPQTPKLYMKINQKANQIECILSK
jgi:hypothetical protein